MDTAGTDVADNDSMDFGERDGYRWFEVVLETPGLRRLVDAVPETVVDKYVAITSFDSGPLKLSKEEVKKGWTFLNDVAYSPRVQSPDDLPADQYDEWWIFEHPTEFKSVQIFVNNGGFKLSAPKDSVDDPTWDLTGQQHWASVQRGWQDDFWRLVGENEPTTYIASNGRLLFVTRDPKLAMRVEEWLRSQDELTPEDRKRDLAD